MRGEDRQGQASMWSDVPLEQRVPADHPLRPMRQLVDAILRARSPTFDRRYARGGRPSMAPAKLRRALLLQVLYTVRSERRLMEQLDYNLLFRWFVGLEMDDPIRDPTVFTRHRERRLAGDVARAFFDQAVAQARARGLLSDEPFTVDGTLIEAWAGLKSFQRTGTTPPPPGDPSNPTVNFRGEKRSHAPHASTTEAEAQLVRTGQSHEAKLYFQGHVLMENRNGLAVSGQVTPPTGRSAREAALAMVAEVATGRRVTLGADRSHDTAQFVEDLRRRGVTPHVAQNTANRRSAIDDRTTRHRGYAVSRRKRKLVEEVFGWLKPVGLMRKTRHRGTARVGWMFVFSPAVYNVVRIRHLAAQAA